MTFSEALEATKSLTLYEDRHATHTEFVLAAMAQQIEANRIAIEELHKRTGSLEHWVLRIDNEQ